jgi:hypothetical protein
MARKRPSSHKREREYQKRQRELRKAEKAAQKRERRFNRGQQDDASPLGEDGDGAVSAEGKDAT